MHVWRKLANQRWLSAHGKPLQARARGRLVIISRPGRKRLQLEIACTSRNVARKLTEEFGGRAEKWPRDWLKRFTDLNKSKPLKVGKRLLISTTASSRAKPKAYGVKRAIRSGRPEVRQPLVLVIPASAAFGTGEHATTAMSLRLLERLSRKWEKGWSLADLGTGTGILALAAKRFGAGRVTGIDIDPRAISIAKANARLNKIDNADFRLGDVRRWKPGVRWDVIAANLYNGLLISVVSKLRRSNWLILSGVLHRQEAELLRVLQKNNMEIASVKRRGKWIALMACKRRTSNPQRPKLNHF
jgi:ribosomal protein L11 methyltransferase